MRIGLFIPAPKSIVGFRFFEKLRHYAVIDDDFGRRFVKSSEELVEGHGLEKVVWEFGVMVTAEGIAGTASRTPRFRPEIYAAVATEF